LEIEEGKSLSELADEINALYLLEDPKDEQHLQRAGMKKAQGIVAALEDDLDNMAIVLSARDMALKMNNQRLRILARVSDEVNMRRMYLAGADRVIAPNFFAGYQIASQMLSHAVGEFWDYMMLWGRCPVRFGDLDLSENPEWVGKTPHQLKQEQNQTVLAIKRGGQYISSPDFDEMFEEKDVLIIFGSSQ